MVKRKTLREYVNSFGRTTRQYEIAAKLGLREERLSKLLKGVKPTPNEANLLRANGIDVAA